jgi:hypothetical protein
MNVEIGAEAVQFPEKEYINGIAFAVWLLRLFKTEGQGERWLVICYVVEAEEGCFVMTKGERSLCLAWRRRKTWRRRVKGMFCQEGGERERWFVMKEESERDVLSRS